MATIGIDVSGSVVPIAARTLPTAPSDRFRRLPSHSIAFVNSAQAPSVTTTDAPNKKYVDEQRHGRPFAAGRPLRIGQCRFLKHRFHGTSRPLGNPLTVEILRRGLRVHGVDGRNLDPDGSAADLH